MNHKSLKHQSNRKRSLSDAAHGRCTDADGRGSENSPCALGQGHLVQRQIRYRTSQSLALLFKLLKPLDLITAHTTIFFAPLT